MVIKSKVFLLLSIASLVTAHKVEGREAIPPFFNQIPSLFWISTSQPIYTQEIYDEKAYDKFYDEENSADAEEDGFIDYDYKIKLQNEASYDSRNKKSLLNPNNDFSSDKNYYNRDIFDINAKLFIGKYFDINFRDQAAWKWQEKEKIGDSEIKNYLQELFLVARIYDTIVIDIGRENIISGSAYGWNPTDYMISASIAANPDPRALRDQRLGAYLAKSSLFFEFGQISAVYSPEIEDVDTNEEARQLYKISGRPFDNTMFELLYFREKNDNFGSNIEISVTDDLIIHFEGSATKESNVYTINIDDSSGYEIYNFSKRSDNFNVKSIIGLNYTFPDLHNLIIEFYYNQEGYSKKEWDNFFSMLEYSKTHYNSDIYEISPSVNPYNIYISAANEMFNMTRMSRYYLFCRISKQNIFIDNLDYGLFSFINLFDKSMFLNLNPEYSFFNNFKSGLIVSYYAGKVKSEFGLSSNLYSILWYFSAYF